MVEFLRKSKSRGIKIALVYLIRIPQIYQFSIIWYGVVVRYVVNIFNLTAGAQTIDRKVFGWPKATIRYYL